MNLKPGNCIRHIRSGKLHVVDEIDIKNRVTEHMKYFEKIKRSRNHDS